MILSIAVGIAAVAAAIQFVRLVLADCDLGLLSRGLAPAAAFEGKVRCFCTATASPASSGPVPGACMSLEDGPSVLLWQSR